jgi:hypothetical protein
MVQAHGGEEAIKHHPFFRDVKWKDLEERKIKPPFKPKIVSIPFTGFIVQVCDYCYHHHDHP